MHVHKYLKYSAAPVKTLCILLVAMFLVGIIQFMVAGIGWEFSREHMQAKKVVVEKTEQEQQALDIHNAQKCFAEDGALYLVSTESISSTRESKVIVKDEQGKILFEGKEKDNPYKFIQWEPNTKNRSQHYQEIGQGYLDELNLIGGIFSRQPAVPIVDDRNHRMGHWFFDPSERIFKYYDIDGKLGGYLAKNGYCKNKAEAAMFEPCHKMINWLRSDTYDPIMIYRADNAIYQIDFANKQVEKLVETKDDPIRSMVLQNWQETEEYDYRPSLAVITKSNKCYLFLKKPDQSIQMQLPNNFRDNAIPIFAANDNTIFAQYSETLGAPKTNDREAISAWYRENRNKPIDYKILLFEVDKNGTFTEKSTFTWTKPAEQSANIKFNDKLESISKAIFYSVNSISSPVPRWITWHKLKTRNYHQGPVWAQAIMEFIRAYSNFKTPINICVMSVFALLALLHGWPRRTNIAKLAFWVVFVFLFNLPGLLTYLALNHFAVIQCANCGKKRSLLQNACCRCGVTFPLPKAKETDLIMTLSA